MTAEAQASITLGATFGAVPEPEAAAKTGVPTDRRLVEVSTEFADLDAIIEHFGEETVVSIINLGINYRFASPGRSMIKKGKTDEEIQDFFVNTWQPGVSTRGTKSRETLLSDVRKTMKRLNPKLTDDQLDLMLSSVETE